MALSSLLGTVGTVDPKVDFPWLESTPRRNASLDLWDFKLHHYRFLPVSAGALKRQERDEMLKEAVQ